jgi:hypothetical protein
MWTHPPRDPYGAPVLEPQDAVHSPAGPGLLPSMTDTNPSLWI